MRKIIFNQKWLAILVIVATTVLVSCSREEEKIKESNTDTKVTVYLRDSNGTPLNNWVVYAFNEFAWSNESIFLAKQSATEGDGRATFTFKKAIDIDPVDDQEVFRFVVYYTKTKQNVFGNQISSQALKKVVVSTLKTGENKTIEIRLN